MTDFSDPAWLERFRQAANADRELAAIGEWFTLDIALVFGQRRHVLRIEAGKVVEILDQPRWDTPVAYAFSAPLEVWGKFIAKVPQPLYHDFFAMLMRVPEFTVEGDTLRFAQNARATHRLMNILRGMER